MILIILNLIMNFGLLKITILMNVYLDKKPNMLEENNLLNVITLYLMMNINLLIHVHVLKKILSKLILLYHKIIYIIKNIKNNNTIDVILDFIEMMIINVYQ